MTEKAKSLLYLPVESATLYLEKRPLARRYPFTDIFFIGASYSEALRGNWESLGHELGHQLYWNAEFLVSTSAYEKKYKYPLEGLDSIFQYEVESVIDNLKQEGKLLERETEELGSILENWFEEIFADMIGALLFEQSYVDSTTRMVLERCRNQNDLTSDDGQHPPYYLRPYICAYTINPNIEKEIFWQKLNEKIAAEFAPDGIEIDRNWKPSISGFEFDIVTKSIELLIGMIKAKISNKHIQPIRKPKTKNFSNFKDWVSEILESNNASKGELIEYILTPRILERTKTHSTKNRTCPECGKNMTKWECPTHYGP